MMTIDFPEISVKRSEISDDPEDHEMWGPTAADVYCRVTGNNRVDWVARFIPLGKDVFLVQFSNMADGFDAPLEPPCIVRIVD